MKYSVKTKIVNFDFMVTFHNFCCVHILWNNAKL